MLLSTYIYDYPDDVWRCLSSSSDAHLSSSSCAIKKCESESKKRGRETERVVLREGEGGAWTEMVWVNQWMELPFHRPPLRLLHYIFIHTEFLILSSLFTLHFSRCKRKQHHKRSQGMVWGMERRERELPSVWRENGEKKKNPRDSGKRFYFSSSPSPAILILLCLALSRQRRRRRYSRMFLLSFLPSTLPFVIYSHCLWCWCCCCSTWCTLSSPFLGLYFKDDKRRKSNDLWIEIKSNVRAAFMISF